MKKIALVLALLVGAYSLYEQWTHPERVANETHSASLVPDAASARLAEAFRERRSNIQVHASGTVVRVLADDNEGSRHQRFIVAVGPEHTVLIAHNIDLAPRVPDLKVGERVAFNGEYEWNERGGVVHWTHHDPQGRHEGGWIEYRQKIYQ
jgi:hypothetical protein